MLGQGSNPQIDPLLVPFLQTKSEAEAQLQLDRLIDLAAPTIKKVTSWSRDPDDAFQETAQRLIEQLCDFKANPAGKPIGSYIHYVKVVASHVAKGQLRDRHPQRRSLVDALRYVLKRNLRFAVWENENRERLCGFAKWRDQPITFTRSERLTQLLDQPDTFGEVVMPARDPLSLDHAELLVEIFNWVGHPIRYDDLIRIVCDLKHAEHFAPILGVDEAQARPLSERLPDARPLPDEVAEWSELLGRLWAEIDQLPRLQRMAYLLNFTAGDGQLELFWIYGVVSVRGIGAALQITEDQFVRVWPELQLSEEHRCHAESALGYDERFALLWQYLPLTDAAIARVLGTERQKVINLRKAAGDRISRRLAQAGRAKFRKGAR
jgi:hypothetical protein